MSVLGPSSVVNETDCHALDGRVHEPPSLTVILLSGWSLVNLMAFVLREVRFQLWVLQCRSGRLTKDL